MKNKGIIPINKPKDWTSFDVVNKLKYKVRPLKVGHLGTLDPMATGVLLVTVGKATKLFDLMQEKTKTYIATFQFGYLTDTLDATGTTIEQTENIPTKEDILRVLPKFVGKIEQIPPKYSAKSVNGVRAYDLARQNIDFELKPKTVEIFVLNLLSYENGSLTLEISCGSGTYIRSIGRDLAKELNSFATMTSLTRTKVGDFTLESCFKIENLDNVEQIMLPISKILTYPILNLDEMQEFKLLNGQKLVIDEKDGLYSIIKNNDIEAIVEIKQSVAKMQLFLG